MIDSESCVMKELREVKENRAILYYNMTSRERENYIKKSIENGKKIYEQHQIEQ